MRVLFFVDILGDLTIHFSLKPAGSKNSGYVSLLTSTCTECFQNSSNDFKLKVLLFGFLFKLAGLLCLFFFSFFSQLDDGQKILYYSYCTFPWVSVILEITYSVITAHSYPQEEKLRLYLQVQMFWVI